jgi:hypothetical protein
MKGILIAAVCAIAAFAGLFFYMRSHSPTPTPDGLPIVTDFPTDPRKPSAEEETPVPRTRPKPPAANDAKPPKGQERNVWTDAPKPVPKSKMPYYTVMAGRGTVPSRVIIHNTSLGVPLNIILVGADSADGRLFIRKGTKDKHQWEVAVTDGLLSVYWDGQEVPPG